MKAKLLVVGGDAKAVEINLNLPVIIGRGREATLTLPHPLVSRKHCELFEADGTLMVRDLGSLNGTYVGSQRVTESELPPGELLTIATINFRAVYAESNNDSTHSTYDIGNEDSTHGAPNSSRRPAAQRPPSPPPNDAKPPQVAPSKAAPIERDTEWQIGTISPRSDAKDDDDLSSLLNDQR